MTENKIDSNILSGLESAQGLAEDRRISIRSIKLSSAPRSLANEIEIEYHVQKPMKKYVGLDKNNEHKFKTILGVEHQGNITLPIHPEKDLSITGALFELKCQCEEKLSEIFGIALDSSHPNFKTEESKEKLEE